jgi:teichuronic acid biosynthesis glycosyltransferase TuaC
MRSGFDPETGPKLRVLLFSTVFPNAAQPYHGVFVRERMRGMMEGPGGVEVRVVAPTPWFPLVSGLRPGFRPSMPREESQDGVQVLHPRFLSVPGILKCLDGLLMFLWTLPTLLRLRREFPFQVIDAHFAYPEGLAAVLAGLVLRVPVTITLRGTLPHFIPFHLRRPQLRFALRRAARVIAVSESLRRDAVSLGIPAEKVRVIGNGIDPEVFHPVDRIEARRALGLPKYGPLLVSVGTLAPRKGFHLVMEAMAKLGKRWPTLRFAIVGGDGAEGAMEAELRALAKRLKIEDRMVFAGPRRSEELAAWYGAADLFVLATAHEGCPNVVLEALACGTPVVATPVGSIPELLAASGEAPEVGLVIERTAESIAAGIDAALNRAWDRDRVRARIASRTWRVVGREQAEELWQAAGYAVRTVEPEGAHGAPCEPAAVPPSQTMQTIQERELVPEEVAR